MTDGSQAQILFVGIESTGGAGDIGCAGADGSMPAEEPKPETSTSMPVSSLKPSAAISAIGRQVVEPATVMEEVEDPEEQAHSVSVSTAALRTDTIFLIASRRSQHGAHRCRPRYGRNKAVVLTHSRKLVSTILSASTPTSTSASRMAAERSSMREALASMQENSAAKRSMSSWDTSYSSPKIWGPI
mgnify:CR=1 FL=1